MPDGAYSLPDLCALADVTPRTVRYYIAEGLLRSPGTTGPGARYDDGHLSRLRLIRRLQREHLPLAEIRNRLAALSDAEVIAQASGPAEPPTGSALDYVRSVLGERALRATPPVAGPPAMPPTAAPTGPVPAAAPGARPAPPSVPAAPAAPRADAPAQASRPAGSPAVMNRLDVDVAALPGAEMELGLPPDRSHWERIVLAPGFELHVRRPLTRFQNRAMGQLVAFARRLLEEEQ